MTTPLLILIAGPYRSGTGDAEKRGLPVYNRLEDVPGCAAAAEQPAVS
jgi:hypothetical protein